MSQSKVEEKPSSQNLFDEQLPNVAAPKILHLALGNMFWERILPCFKCSLEYIANSMNDDNNNNNNNNKQSQRLEEMIYRKKNCTGWIRTAGWGKPAC